MADGHLIRPDAPIRAGRRRPARRLPSRAAPVFFSAVLALLLWSTLTPVPLFASPATGLTQPYLQLKEQFEAGAKKAREPQVLVCLALKTTALAWATAAAEQSGRARAWARKTADFTRAWNKLAWEERELAALTLYYQALTELAARELANQAGLAAELAHIVGETEKQLAEAADSAAESRVLLTSALVTALPLLIRSAGGLATEEPAGRVLKDLVKKGQDINRRGGTHYQARMALLYLNNTQGLTKLVFLLAHSAGPPVASDLALVRDAWTSIGDDRPAPEALSLAWAAQAQAAPPLAFWLAGRLAAGGAKAP